MKRLRLFGHALRLMLRGALHRPYEVITLTLGALAVTLLVLVVLGIKAGLERTLESAGSQDLLIVLGNGAEAEITSAFAIPEVNAITTAARMAGEAPLLISPEVYVNTRVGIGADGGIETLALRGLAARGLSMRRNFHLVAGRAFNPARRELIVGRELALRFPALAVGRAIEIAGEPWRVTGVFSASETVAESELFGGATLIQDAFRRQGVFQSIRITRADGQPMAALADDIRQSIAASTSVNLTTEDQYYAEQIEALKTFINYLSLPSMLIILAATAMATVNSSYTIMRTYIHAISVMRAIGYPVSVLCAAIGLQAFCLSNAGIELGIVLSLLFFDNLGASMMNYSSFSEVFFSLEIGASAILLATAAAWLSALIGGLPAMFWIARMSVARGLRLP